MNDKKEFLIAGITSGQLNAMVKNIMAQTGISDPAELVKMINSGKLYASTKAPNRGEKNGAIRLSVTSDGTTGEQWLKRLKAKGIPISQCVKKALLSREFESTKNIDYNVVILKGDEFSKGDNICNLTNVRNEAKKHFLYTPSIEVACLIREECSNGYLEDAGLCQIIVMHEPIKSFLGGSRLFIINSFYDLELRCFIDNLALGRSYGFAFIDNNHQDEI